MIEIVDTSVAIKWFVVEEELHDEAIAVLDKIKDSPREFAVPELFFNEMLAVLCRLLHQPAVIQDYMNALQDLGLARLGNGRATLSRAVSLAKKHGLSGYDAIYAANAELVDGIWITADETAHKKLARLGISKLLADY